MQLPRWLFIEYNVGENNNLTQLTGDYGYLASINRSDEYNNPYYLAIVFDNTDEQNLEDYIADHRISNVPTVVLFPSDKEIMLAKLIREKMGLNLQHLPYHERSDLATLVDNWLQDVARKSQSRLKSADIQIVEISEGVNMLPQVLQNAKKEEIVPEDEGRYHFLRIAEVLTRRVYNTDLQGGIIKIATQTAGPWVKSDKDGQIVNLDETLAALAKDAVLKHSREKDESAVRIVCPFSLKNLHHIRKWHTTRGVEIRINTAMDHTVFKW
ncbi:MAG: hypothetical protein KJZ60_10115, partial [Ignavibacteriaceae bacterium]|nr:hypothetical protein [Ignavibacteriaceae bacterium]